MSDLTVPRDVALAAPYQAFFRWTISPGSREAGNHGWDAVPVAEWYEVGPDASLDSVRAAIACLGDRGRAGTRIDRQRAAHSAGRCRRQAPHWDAAR